jgi:hypothetical protein
LPSLPSTVEYIFEGTKISLQLLSQAASLIPVPYIHTAVEVASKLMAIGEVGTSEASFRRHSDLGSIEHPLANGADDTIECARLRAHAGCDWAAERQEAGGNSKTHETRYRTLGHVSV